MRAKRQDSEAALEARLVSSRRDLVRAARALSRTVRSDFSPLATVRRDPWGSLAAGLATGVALGLVFGPKSRKAARAPQARADGSPPAAPSFASTVSSLATLLPPLASFILPLLRHRERDRDPDDLDPSRRS